MKKIIYIVLGALLVFGLLFLMWSWFFSGSSNTNNQTGSFGTASTTQNTGGTGGASGNGITNLGNNGGNTVTNGTIPLGGNGSGGIGSQGNGSIGSVDTGFSTGSSTTFSSATAGIDGVNWLSVSGSGGLITGVGFNPLGINGLGGQGIGGSVPTIQSLNGSNGSGSSDFTRALIGAAVTGAVTCGAKAAFGLGAAAVGGTSVGAFAAVGVPVGGLGIGTIAASQVAQTSYQTANQTNSFFECIINVLAKAALTQITASVVNWINSGFNGQPSFVTNYQQFFTNVADQAAGEFIKGSGLAFLCSPFQLQIKVAIARAYANRNAQSCTLTKVIKNINGFMNGNFAQGGWGGFVSFTTMPLNNPYGSYAYAQISLGNAISNAQTLKNNELQRNGGYQDVTKPRNCRLVPPSIGSGPPRQVCDAAIVTPGSTVASAVANTLNIPQAQLALSNSFDQIINALMNQLLTRSLYHGLTNLNGDTLYTQSPQDAAAQAQAQALLTDLQTKVSLAQQYGSILQGSASDIEQAQVNLNTLQNCWLAAASSTSLSASQQSNAAASASGASSTISTLNIRVATFNDSITGVNAVIANIEQVETQALTVGSVADVTALQNAYNSLIATGALITQTDVTTAQQDRTTLQSEMTALNQSTSSSLAQCRALH